MESLNRRINPIYDGGRDRNSDNRIWRASTLPPNQPISAVLEYQRVDSHV